MTGIRKIVSRICRKWMKMRLQPIRVFCFHQTSETFDTNTMYFGDWTQIEQFKRNILRLKEQYSFISLPEAYDKMKHDTFRLKKFAVLTADDGWVSLKNILPWLAEHQIPITLFVNPAFLKGEETRENGMNGLLSWGELKEILSKYPNITIASHGWSHSYATSLSEEEFEKDVLRCQKFLQKSNRYIDYYAYPCGYCSTRTEAVLHKLNIVPVYMEGKLNYTYMGGIHRESLDGLCL